MIDAHILYFSVYIVLLIMLFRSYFYSFQGVKRAEQFVILENFRKAVKANTDEAHDSEIQSAALPRSASIGGDLRSLKNRKDASLRDTLLKNRL